MAPNTWRELVKETRERLGLSREEFAALLGISLSALNHWEYAGVLPPPLYQDMIVQLYNNHQALRKQLDVNKAKYVYSLHAKKHDSGDEFWKGFMTGSAVVGAMALLVKSLKK